MPRHLGLRAVAASTIRVAARGAGAAVLLAVLATAPVTAHAELVLSLPARNSSVKTAPTSVVLEFTEEVDRDTSIVQVLDAGGRSLGGVGQPQLAAGGRSLTLSLPALQPAIYTVTYQVTSASDGHVTSGAFVFQYDPTGILPPPSGAATSSSPSADLATVLARWIALLGMLILLGSTVFWLVSARPALRAELASDDAPVATESGRGAPWGGLTALSIIAFLALAVFLTLAAAALSAAGHQHEQPAISLDFAAPFGWTPFAIAMRAALIGTGVCVAMTAARFLWPGPSQRSEEMDRFATAVVVLFSAVALGGMSLGGHAAASGLPFAAVDWLHLLSVAAWLGTLGGLGLLAWRVRRLSVRRGVLLSALRRHSRVALVAAPLVAITGIVNSPLVIGQVRQVVASAYGDLVLAKATLFSGAVAIGAVNYFLVRRRSLGQAAALISAEAVLGCAAALAAATMLSIQPAATRVPVLSQSTIQPVHLYGATGVSTVHAAVDIPAPGDQLYEVLVSDSSGAPRTDLRAIDLRLTPPPGSTLPIRDVPLRPSAEPTVWATRGAYTPATGDWQIEVLVSRDGQPTERVAFALTVAQPLPAERVPPPNDGANVPAPLAVLWFLPGGVGGWLLVGLLVTLMLGLWAWERARPQVPARRGMSLARTALAGLSVIAVLGVGSRAVVDAANRPTHDVPNPIAPTTASIESGRLIYLANCSSCHGASGIGDGPQAAGMLPAPGAIGSAVASLTDGELRYLVTSGMAGTKMPSFATSLSENDRWDLVNYLRSLRVRQADR